MAQTTILLGGCPKCGTGIAIADSNARPVAKCPNPACGVTVRLARVKAEYNAAKPCNDACQYARSTKCSCACGGGNHGCGYIAPYAHRPEWVIKRDADAVEKRQQRAADKRLAARNQAITALVARVGTPVQQAWLADTSEACTALAGADFFLSVAETLAKYGAVTDRQAAAATAVLDRLAPGSKPAPTPAPAAGRTAAAPAGTVQVVGTVAAVRAQDSGRGRPELKMRVRADAGYGVWLTVPYAIRAAVDPRFEHGLDLAGHLVGARVQFTAALTPTANDPTFAWGNRASGAELLALPVAVSA